MTSTTARAQEIAAFYARYASWLQRIVSTKVNAPAQTIEDACQNAWATLLRRADVTLDERGAAWLATVAIHEGWRLMRRGEVPAGAMRPGVPRGCELPEPAADEPGADEQALARIDHAERVADLRSLKPHERRELYLQALGYRYREIAALSRDVRVNVAVLLRSDVDDMSLMETSLGLGVRRPLRDSGRCARGCCSCLWLSHKSTALERSPTRIADATPAPSAARRSNVEGRPSRPSPWVAVPRGKVEGSAPSVATPRHGAGVRARAAIEVHDLVSARDATAFSVRA